MEVEWYDDWYTKHYTREEATELFLPVQERVFVPADTPDWFAAAPSQGTALFTNPDWKVVSFVPYIGTRKDGTLFDHAPRAPGLWNPSGYGTWSALRPLAKTLLEFGVTELINVGAPNWYEYSTSLVPHIMVSCLTADGFRIFEGEDFCISTEHNFQFSREGNWGFLYGSDIGGYLGGEPELVDRLIELYGGEEELKTQMDWEWTEKLGNMNRHYFTYPKNGYAMCGWEMPDALKEWERENMPAEG